MIRLLTPGRRVHRRIARHDCEVWQFTPVADMPDLNRQLKHCRACGAIRIVVPQADRVGTWLHGGHHRPGLVGYSVRDIIGRCL